MSRLGSAISLVGDKELEKTLLKLSDRAAAMVMRPAISAGLTPVMKEAKLISNQKFKSDSLAKLIGKKAWSKKDKVSGKIFMLPNKSTRTIKIKGKDVPFEVAANIQEFGRKDGSLESHAFMRPALGNKKSDALKALTNKARELLPRVIQKLRAKGKPVYIGDSK